MGRYLVGTKQFSYKYIYAEQDANLRQLAGASGAGMGGLEPLLSASMDELERTDDIAVMELLRAAVRRTGSVGGETRALLSRGNVVHPRSFEFVMYAVAESIVPVVAILDEKLEAAAEMVNLCGRAAYELRRADHEKLLAWINGFLKKPLTMKAIAGDVGPIGEELRGVEEYLPFMGLYILHHAVVNDLDVISVAESMPETTTDDYWTNARNEWGPPEVFSRTTVPQGADALFARALVAFWEGERDEALSLLRQSHDSGDGRAHRWLSAGGDKVKPLAKPTTHARQDHASYLESLFAFGDLEAEWSSLDEPDLAALDRLLKGKTVAATELRRLVSSRSEQLDDVARFSKEARTIKNEALRRVAEEILQTAELEQALEAEDTKAMRELLVQARERGSFDVDSAGPTLSLMLDHGTPKDVQLVFDVIRALVPLDLRTDSHVAYNLACAAARLGNKAEMLMCLRAAKLDGDEPCDALDDNDFAAWHDDPDLRALANEPS